VREILATINARRISAEDVAQALGAGRVRVEAARQALDLHYERAGQRPTGSRSLKQLSVHFALLANEARPEHERKSAREIARELGVSRNTVARRARK
jgi:biotin operon repressor